MYFSAGGVDSLEELREERVNNLIAMVQAWIRGFETRKSFAKLEEKRLALVVVQRNLRRYIRIHAWKWQGLFENIRPLLNITKIEDEMKALAEKTAKALDDLEKETKHRKNLEIENMRLQEDKYDLMATLDSSKADIKEFLEKQAKLQSQKTDLEMQLEVSTLTMASVYTSQLYTCGAANYCEYITHKLHKHNEGGGRYIHQNDDLFPSRRH